MSRGLGTTQRQVLDFLRGQPDHACAIWWVTENVRGDPSQHEQWRALPYRKQRETPRPITTTPTDRAAIRRAVHTLAARGLVTLSGNGTNTCYASAQPHPGGC